jgi:aryl-alcohol dehydrogenase-like predicted oxidoreductase
MKDLTAPGHFSEQQGLMMSSIGAGTYLGEVDSQTDESYRTALAHAVANGVNVLDTAINYRFQRSERAIGQMLRDLSASGNVSREGLILATKAGYLTFDGDRPENPRDYFMDTFVNPGIIAPHDIVAGSHCMTPRYLQHQLDQSLQNLGVHTIDIFYLHNPETQLAEMDREEFYKRLRVAFGFLESAVSSGKIQMYGTATWNAYRVAPESQDFISIEDAIQCARDIAGDSHHFRVVQLPYNLAMTEAYTTANQKLEGKVITTLEACRDLGITVMASASLLQSRLSTNLPEFVSELFPGFKTDSQRAIQFVRSTPGIAVALVGMSSVTHVDENLFVSTIPPATGQATPPNA